MMALEDDMNLHKFIEIHPILVKTWCHRKGQGTVKVRMMMICPQEIMFAQHFMVSHKAFVQKLYLSLDQSGGAMDRNP